VRGTPASEPLFFRVGRSDCLQATGGIKHVHSAGEELKKLTEFSIDVSRNRLDLRQSRFS
jgi:hypothetical protein